MTKEERTKRVSTIRGYHDEVFEYLGITEAYFYPRYLVKKNGLDCSLWFYSEVSKPTDLYTEVVLNQDLDTIPGKRQLYKIKYNPHWREEYQMEKLGGIEYYIIPFDQYQPVLIKEEHIAEKKMSDIHDDLMTNLTMRDFYAMIQNVPVSKKNWLNETINQNQRI